MRKETIIYVGIDLHKETHTAVILDCWNQKGLAVKDVNTTLSYAQRKSVPMYQRSDSYDAVAVALVLTNFYFGFDKLLCNIINRCN